MFAVVCRYIYLAVLSADSVHVCLNARRFSNRIPLIIGLFHCVAFGLKVVQVLCLVRVEEKRDTNKEKQKKLDIWNKDEEEVEDEEEDEEEEYDEEKKKKRRTRNNNKRESEWE